MGRFLFIRRNAQQIKAQPRTKRKRPTTRPRSTSLLYIARHAARVFSPRSAPPLSLARPLPSCPQPAPPSSSTMVSRSALVESTSVGCHCIFSSGDLTLCFFRLPCRSSPRRTAARSASTSSMVTDAFPLQPPIAAPHNIRLRSLPFVIGCLPLVILAC